MGCGAPPENDVAVNRWPHGYAPEFNTLWSRTWNAATGTARARSTFGANEITGSDREILLPFFGRPRFFGGGSATTFRPKPLAKASLDRAAAYSGATIGYDGGRPHLIWYSSGVV